MSSIVFGLSNTVIRCGESMTLDEFRDGLLVDGKPNEPDLGLQGHGSGFNSDKVRRNISFLDLFRSRSRLNHLCLAARPVVQVSLPKGPSEDGMPL